MKRIDSRRKWILLTMVAALCAPSWLCIRFASFPEPKAAAGEAVIEDTVISSENPTPRPHAVRRRDVSPALQHLTSRTDRATPSDGIHPVMQRALDDHPELSQYHWLARKVLTTEDQRRMREEMLSDPEMIQNAKIDLLASSENVYSREEEAKRMLQIEFLSDAIAWTENPEIEAVAEAIEDIILAENILRNAPDDLAKSLAGDKMDLYTQVLHSSPERAAVIAEHASGKNVEPLLAYSKKWYDDEMLAMRADEHP